MVDEMVVKKKDEKKTHMDKNPPKVGKKPFPVEGENPPIEGRRKPP